MSILTILLVILVVILALVGVMGAIIPAIPGPPISWVAMLLIFYAGDGVVTTSILLWMLGLTIVTTILDYVAPALLTKIGGGSKAATTGATIGTIAGLFFAPWGLLLGPLVGAFLGEYITDARLGKSIKIATLSFLSFLLTTGMKLVACLWMTYYIVLAIWQML